MQRKFRFDREKFKHLVHYLTWRIGDGDSFEAAELFKMLWLTDARMFMLHDKPVTGTAYARDAAGLRARGGNAVLDELAREGAIKVAKDKACGYSIVRVKAALAPKAEFFPPDELDAAEWSLRNFGDPIWDQIWKLAAIGEPVAYEAILAIRVRRPDERNSSGRGGELGLV